MQKYPVAIAVNISFTGFDETFSIHPTEYDVAECNSVLFIMETTGINGGTVGL